MGALLVSCKVAQTSHEVCMGEQSTGKAAVPPRPAAVLMGSLNKKGTKFDS